MSKVFSFFTDPYFKADFIFKGYLSLNYIIIIDILIRLSRLVERQRERENDIESKGERERERERR